MKECQCCEQVKPIDMHTCDYCGQASWRVIVVPSASNSDEKASVAEAKLDKIEAQVQLTSKAKGKSK